MLLYVCTCTIIIRDQYGIYSKKDLYGYFFFSFRLPPGVQVKVHNGVSIIHSYIALDCVGVCVLCGVAGVTGVEMSVSLDSACMCMCVFIYGYIYSVYMIHMQYAHCIFTQNKKTPIMNMNSIRKENQRK